MSRWAAVLGPAGSRRVLALTSLTGVHDLQYAGQLFQGRLGAAGVTAEHVLEGRARHVHDDSDVSGVVPVTGVGQVQPGRGIPSAVRRACADWNRARPEACEKGSA
jgi:hypothetical protein